MAIKSFTLEDSDDSGGGFLGVELLGDDCIMFIFKDIDSKKEINVVSVFRDDFKKGLEMLDSERRLTTDPERAQGVGADSQALKLLREIKERYEKAGCISGPGWLHKIDAVLASAAGDK